MDGRRLEPWGKVTGKEVKWPAVDSWPLGMLCSHVREVSPYEYGLILTVLILSWDDFHMNIIHLPNTSPYPRLSDKSLKATRSAQPTAHLSLELTGPGSRQSRGAAPPALLTLWQIASPHSNTAFSFRVVDIQYIFKIKLAKAHAGG